MNEATFNEFLLAFPMRRTRAAELDLDLATSAAALDVLFLWGRDCVNCEIAKAAMLASSARFHWPDVRWLHANVYADPDLATRFGLHGVPTFLVFHHGRRLGRITEWPGTDAFVTAIEVQRTRLGAPRSDG